MDPGARTTQALTVKIDRNKDELIRHYEALMVLVSTKNPSRNTSALLQYQIQVETNALVRAGEELQLLIRQMQEMWLFGQLNTLGESEVQQQTDDNAKAVGRLLGRVLAMREGKSLAGVAEEEEGKEPREVVGMDGIDAAR